MGEPKSNIETVAYDICARQLTRVGTPPDEVQLAVDRYWHCVAAETEADLIDETGVLVSHDYLWGVEAYRDWRRRRADCDMPGVKRVCPVKLHPMMTPARKISKRLILIRD
jgi:hypothetical protein